MQPPKSETTPLVDLLRLFGKGDPLCKQAADEIERLRAELEAAKADIAMLIQKETEACNAEF